MIRAYLRIDDSPSNITPDIIDFLSEKGITPVIFATGEDIESHFDNAVYALKKGSVIGNHSFTHRNFAELSFDECVAEIEMCENALDKLYKYASIEREHKLFAFPYGNKGESNKELIQQYLKDNGFSRIDDSDIRFDWYKKQGHDKDIDIYWTFDFAEYQLEQNNGFEYEDIINRINDKHPSDGAALLEENSFHIAMIHDHEQTNAIVPDYYKKIIDYVTERGVEFISPKFLKV